MSIRLVRRLLLAPDESSGRVSLTDVEGKLRELSGTTQALASEVAKPTLGAAVAAAALAVVAVYLLGRRRGRRQATVLEIRRV